MYSADFSQNVWCFGRIRIAVQQNWSNYGRLDPRAGSGFISCRISICSDLYTDGPSSNAHLLELLKYILIYFFAFFDSLYIILNIAASAEKSTVTYFVTASGK